MKRITFDIHPNVLAKFDMAAEKAGSRTRAEAIRKALNLYTNLIECSVDGKISVESKDGTHTILVH